MYTFRGFIYIHKAAQPSPLILQSFITPKRNPILICITPIPPLPVPDNHSSVSMDLSILDNSNEWDHIACVLLCLASLPQHSISKVHPWCGVDQDFILSESAYLTSFPGSSDEWALGRKRTANSHKVKLLIIIRCRASSILPGVPVSEAPLVTGRNAGCLPPPETAEVG